MAALITVGGGLPVDEGGKLDFKIDLRRSAAVLGGLHPATADPLARRTRPCATCPPTCTARSRRTIPAWCVALATIRARSSRQAGADRPALPRPAGLRADRQQPVARSAGADRRADHRWAKHPAAQQVPVSSHRRLIRIRDPGRCSCRRACRRARDRRRTRRSRCRCRPTNLAPRRRRGPYLARRTRSCRRTAERRRPPGPCSPRRRHPRRPPSRRHCPRRRRPQLASGPADATYDQKRECSSTRPAGLGCTRPVLTNWRPRRTGRSDAGSEAGVMTEERASAQRRSRRHPCAVARRGRPAREGGAVDGSSAGVRVEAPTTGKAAVPRPARSSAAPAPESQTGRRSWRWPRVGRGGGAGRGGGVLIVAAAARRGQSKPAISGSSTPRRRPW